ncbi:MAG: phospholipase A [Moraxellaceae bacterium]
MPRPAFALLSPSALRGWLVLPLVICGLPLAFANPVPTASAASTAVETAPAPSTPAETIAADLKPEQTITPASPQACLALDSSADRLSCYDTAFGRQPLQATETTAVPAESTAQISATTTTETADSAKPITATSLLETLNPFNTTDSVSHPDLSLLDRRWELSEQSKLGTFNIRANRPVYLLPAMYTSRINDLPTSPNPVNQVQDLQALKHVEAKFQISLKTKAVEGLFGEYGDVWLGYTQVSRWQVYNEDESRPFRETNYEPEASLIFNTQYQVLGWQGRLLGLTLNHQSNGRALPLSRSWNRAILNIGLEKDNWVVMLKPWYRFAEDTDKNDNADIEDFTGKGELQVVHKRNQNEYALLLRHNLESGSEAKGAVQFDWTFPVKGALRGHVQIFDGYGESLIDYNHRATYVGLGISLSSWY